MLSFIVSNVPNFENHADAVPAAMRAIQSAGWDSSYSRNLIAQNLRWGAPLQYADHTGQRLIQVLHVDIVNRRSDLGAIGTVARLSTVIEGGQEHCSPNRSHLKASGYPGYEQTIFPGSHVAFDLLALASDRPHTVTLNSALDVRPRSTLLDAPGEYLLKYEVFAGGFPVLIFGVILTIRERPVGNIPTAADARLDSDAGPFLSSAD